MRAIIAAILFAACASPASAQHALRLGEPTRGYTYFNKPGASVEQHSQDLRACAAHASALVLPSSMPTDGLIPQLMAIGPARAIYVSGVENCMVVRGWRVYRLPMNEGEVYSNASPALVAEAIAPWIGSDAPYGQFVRAWNNDAALAATDRFISRPSATTRGSLSLLAEGEFEVAPQPTHNAVRLDRRWPTRALRPDQLATAPADSAIIIFNISDVSMRNGIGFVFRRQGDDTTPFPSAIDLAPDMVTVLVPLIQFRHQGNFRAFALPAGRWRLASMGVVPVVSFCLGGPSFEVAAGEVVFAGGFDFNAEKFGPDLSLDAVRAWLGEAPEAARVRPAEYTNGWTGLCGDTTMYAIEFEGAPFTPEYSYGGAPYAPPPAAAPELPPAEPASAH